MKSMPMFQGTIRNVTYENLRLHSVRTGVCINTAGQSCYDSHTGTGTDMGTVVTRGRAGAGVVPHTANRVGANSGAMNVEGITVRNITGVGVQLAGYVNCPNQFKGACTGLVLDNVVLPGARPYYCAGDVHGIGKGCAPAAPFPPKSNGSCALPLL